MLLNYKITMDDKEVCWGLAYFQAKKWANFLKETHPNSDITIVAD